MQFKFGRTSRGFPYVHFKDFYDKKCSLQKSSLASEQAIWFGIDDPEPEIMIPGQRWQPLQIPENVSLNTRMHLTQEQVQVLLPILTHFAEYGELPVFSEDMAVQ